MRTENGSMGSARRSRSRRFGFRFSVSPLTFDAGLPDGVGVAEAGDDVVADGEGELEPVGRAFLEGEPHALGVGLHRQREEDVGAAGGQDRQAHYLHVRLQRLCKHTGGCSKFRSAVCIKFQMLSIFSSLEIDILASSAQMAEKVLTVLLEFRTWIALNSVF